jgi:hypothetical protein
MDTQEIINSLTLLSRHLIDTKPNNFNDVGKIVDDKLIEIFNIVRLSVKSIVLNELVADQLKKYARDIEEPFELIERPELFYEFDYEPSVEPIEFIAEPIAEPEQPEQHDDLYNEYLAKYIEFDEENKNTDINMRDIFNFNKISDNYDVTHRSKNDLEKVRSHMTEIFHTSDNMIVTEYIDYLIDSISYEKTPQEVDEQILYKKELGGYY